MLQTLVAELVNTKLRKESFRYSLNHEKSKGERVFSLKGFLNGFQFSDVYGGVSPYTCKLKLVSVS